MREFLHRLIEQWMTHHFFSWVQARQFASWCRQYVGKGDSTINCDFEEFFQRENCTVEQCYGEISQRIKEQSINLVKITRGNKRDNFVIDGLKTDHLISEIQFTQDVAGTISLKNLNIGTLQIYDRISFDPLIIQASECRIRKLKILSGGSNKNPSSVILQNSNVGLLTVDVGAVKDLHVRGGCVLDFGCPPPDAGNPFVGSVTFELNVFLPRQTRNYPLSGPQCYRNMRAHLRKLENTTAANLFHAVELAVEREKDSWTNRTISRLYEWFSDFGGSILRPFLWLVLFFCGTLLIVTNCDCVVPAFDSHEMTIGWRAFLTEESIEAKWAAALYIVFQSILNPLGIFGHKSLVIPKQPWVAIWLAIHSAISLLLTALAITAIRRRFKLQQSL